MTKLKLGVLGVSGHFIRRIVTALNETEYVYLYGIASRSFDKAKKTAIEFNIEKCYASYEELLKDKSIDMVYIPLPNNLHAEWIKKCADFGKHVICEKPIAMNAEEAEDSINYAKNKNIYVMEAFMYKFHPQWQKVLQLIKINEIGNINAIHIFFGYNNIDPNNIRNIKEAGGGALMDIGCYAVSLSRFLLKKEPARVISLMKIDDDFKTDTLTSVIMDFGMIRSLFTVGTKTYPHQKVDIYGIGGHIRLELPFNMFTDTNARVLVTTSVGTREVICEIADQYKLQFEAFAESIINKKSVYINPDDAVKNMRVIDAIKKSDLSGQWVKI
ncbi:MAG: Gfo/Idh/MocA family oxidoreductase [Spirochaetes bacterium]|nr:Gfo/Idh/MocA family oxidoreductase [Spirochaetota bacterium]